MPVSLTIEKTEGKPGQVYYPLKLQTAPKPVPRQGEVLVRLRAAALNHRDHFIRQHLYPGIAFDVPLLADGVGVVVEEGPPTPPASSSSAATAAATTLLNRRVLLTPSRGWPRDHPLGPPDPSSFAVCGAARAYPDSGTAREYACLPADELEPCPEHLTSAQAAALPLAGLTAWRAVVTKLGPEIAGRPGSNVLITGVGGGVALAAAQFASALGLRVWVTSGSEAKLARARDDPAIGASGGVSYRSPTWDRDLAALLPRDRPFLDGVVDGAGGDVVARVTRLLRPGGVISAYGMTAGPKMDWSMAAVLKNVELRGTTMGSRSEFADMVRFVAEHRIVPVVSRSVRGLDNIAGIDGLYADMRDGKQFGKLVIEISGDDEDEKGDRDSPAKL